MFIIIMYEYTSRNSFSFSTTSETDIHESHANFEYIGLSIIRIYENWNEVIQFTFHSSYNHDNDHFLEQSS